MGISDMTFKVEPLIVSPNLLLPVFFISLYGNLILPGAQTRNPGTILDSSFSFIPNI